MVKFIIFSIVTMFGAGGATELVAADSTITLAVVVASVFGGAMRGYIRGTKFGLSDGFLYCFIGSCCGIFVGSQGMEMFADKMLGAQELSVMGGTFMFAVLSPNFIMKLIKVGEEVKEKTDV